MAQVAATPTVPNTQPSNVGQNFSAFNIQIPASVTGSVGALSSLYSAYNQFQQKNPLLGSLSFASALPHLQQAFPDTFNPDKYTDQSSKDLITGLNTGGQAAKGGLAAYGIYSNLQKGNYVGAGVGTQGLVAQGQNLGYIPDFTSNIQDATGVKPVAYGKGGEQVSGYAPYVTAPVAAYSAFEDFKNKNYVGGAINTAQAGQAGAQIYSAYFPTSQLASTGASTGASATTGATQAAPSLLSSDTLANLAPPIAVAGEAYRIGSEGVSAFNAAKGEGAVKGAQTGFKNGETVGMLQNLDPFALQARVFGGIAGGIFGHKSVKKRQQENWGKLDNVPEGVMAANHAVDDTGIWKDGKYAGQKWTFEKALDLQKTEDPGTFQHVLGNYESIKDYNKLTDAQQKEITMRAANANLYQSKDGDVRVKDQSAIQKIRDEVVGGSKPALDPGRNFGSKIHTLPLEINGTKIDLSKMQTGPLMIDPNKVTPEILQKGFGVSPQDAPIVKVQNNLKVGQPPSAGLSKQDFRNLYLRVSNQGTLLGARA